MIKFPPQQSLGADKPMVGHMFDVMIGLSSLGSFTEVSNLTYEIQPYELVEGGRNHSPHLKPYGAPGKQGELTLKWGSVMRSTFRDWVDSVRLGFTYKRHVTLTQLNRMGVPFRIYILYLCWPKQWKGADLNTNSTEIATEELTLVYDTMDTIVIPLP